MVLQPQMCLWWQKQEIELEDRLQYLWELHVPLRYRWDMPRLPWLDMWKKHPDRVMEWDVFADDDKLWNITFGWRRHG